MPKGVYKRSGDLSPEVQKELVRIYTSSNISLQKTANAMGLTWAVANNWLIKNGVPIRCDKYFLTIGQLTEIYEKYKSGLNIPELAREYNISADSLGRSLKKHGFAIRTQKESCRKHWNDPVFKDFCAQRTTGEKSPNWNGGTTALLSKLRNSSRGRGWRKSVFVRDNYTCQKCGAVDNLHAHHIKEFDQMVKENNITSVEQSKLYPELWDINNGQTICKTCHVAHHRAFQIKHGRYCKK